MHKSKVTTKLSVLWKLLASLGPYGIGVLVVVMFIVFYSIRNQLDAIAVAYSSLSANTVQDIRSSKAKFLEYEIVKSNSDSTENSMSGGLIAERIVKAALDVYDNHVYNVLPAVKENNYKCGMYYWWWYDKVYDDLLYMATPSYNTVKLADDKSELPTKNYRYFKTGREDPSQANWCTMFTSIVLRLAGVSDKLVNASCHGQAMACLRSEKMDFYVFKDSNAFGLSSNRGNEDKVNYTESKYKSNVQYTNKSDFTPKPGDILYCFWDANVGGDNQFHHVRIVVDYNEETGVLTTIEGNWDYVEGATYQTPASSDVVKQETKFSYDPYACIARFKE